MPRFNYEEDWKNLNKEYYKHMKKINQNKLKKKYHRILKIVYNIKNYFEPLSNENKDYLKIKLMKLKYEINKEKQIINKSNKSTKSNNVKISFLNKLESAVNIKELEKKIKKIERDYKKIISDINTVTSIIPGYKQTIAPVISGVLAADSILNENKWYKDKKVKIKNGIKNMKIYNKKCSVPSLNIDEINKEMKNINLKLDKKEVVLVT